jgi:hypothetical protein
MSPIKIKRAAHPSIQVIRMTMINSVIQNLQRAKEASLRDLKYRSVSRKVTSTIRKIKKIFLNHRKIDKKTKSSKPLIS